MNIKFDGYINVSTLKEVFKDTPLVECYGVWVEGVSPCYVMAIPIDGECRVLSTWQSKEAKGFKRSDSLISEAKALGFTSYKFGAFEEAQLVDLKISNRIVTDPYSSLKFVTWLFPLLGITLKADKEKYENLDSAVDSFLFKEDAGVRVLIKDLLNGNVSRDD